MGSQMQPIKLWGRSGPNPPKVAIILEELELPHEFIEIPYSDIKKPAYTAINPNGRLPSIQDPNTGLTLWESGAIVAYLIDRYDTKHKLSFPRGSDEWYLANQWAVFQQSGQGPYYGQAAFFSGKVQDHPRVPGPLDRYAKEVNRVTGVLEAWLTKREHEEGAKAGSDGPWLVGDKCSYADLAFVQWQLIIPFMLTEDEYSVDNFPHVKTWLEKLTARKGVAIALEKTKMHR